jgi:integrase
MPKVPTLHLTPHPSGCWQKRIDGKLYYFGTKGGSKQGAVDELIEFLRRRNAGEQPAAKGRELTLNELASLYAESCERRVSAGSMQRDTWAEYDRVINDFVSILGEAVRVSALSPDRFREVVDRWKGYGAVRRGNQVQVIRTMFNWAGPQGEKLCEIPRYGPFRKPDFAEVRAERYARERQHGQHRFAPDELKAMLAAASGRLRCWILLGLNGGMYSIDIADLRRSDVRKEGKLLLIDTLRRKTSVPRCTPLWPETAKALAPFLRGRGEFLFTTIHGNPFNQRDNNTDSIGQEFREFVQALGIHREGVGFGAFRHTHVSAANAHHDVDARVLVRGHTIGGVDAHYDFPSIQRLRSVTDLVYAVLIRSAVAPAAKPRQRCQTAPAGKSHRSARGGTRPGTS